MHNPYELIQNVALILVIASLIGTVFQMFRLPGVLAFVLTGILIGPGGLNWVSNSAIIQTLAHFGMILLLFVLGVELSLPQLRSLRIHSLWAGIGQLLLAIPILSFSFLMLGLGPRQAIFIGGTLALSSTAIVLKMLEDQAETEAVHGRLIMGILIVQDLALVPLMTFMPILIGQSSGTDMLASFLWVTMKSGLFLGTIVLLSWKYVPKLIDKMAGFSSREMFAVSVLSFALLVSVLAEWVGLSLAVGAFVAGLAISSSVASRQVVANAIPIRDISATVFFVSVGMLFNLHFFLTHIYAILFITLLIVMLKMFTTALVVRIMRYPLKTVLWCGLSLFQVGEFSFVLLQTGLQAGAIGSDLLSTVTSAIVISMLMTPLVMRSIPAIWQWFESRRSLMRPIEQFVSFEAPTPLKDEVVVAGYGPIAQNLIQILREHGIGVRVIEMNINTVHKLRAEGIHCIFGDVSNREVLEHANLQEAKIFAVTVPDIRSAEVAVQHAKQINPDIYCIVRSRYQKPIEDLFMLGTDEVVYEEFETSLSFIYSILDFFDDVITDMESYMLLLRENKRAMMHSGTLGSWRSTDEQVKYGRFSVFKETKIEWLSIPPGSSLIGKTLAEAALRNKTGVNVISIIHPNGEDQINPGPEWIIREDQVLVVMGTIQQLQSLESMLC